MLTSNSVCERFQSPYHSLFPGTALGNSFSLTDSIHWLSVVPWQDRYPVLFCPEIDSGDCATVVRRWQLNSAWGYGSVLRAFWARKSYTSICRTWRSVDPWNRYRNARSPLHFWLDEISWIYFELWPSWHFDVLVLGGSDLLAMVVYIMKSKETAFARCLCCCDSCNTSTWYCSINLFLNCLSLSSSKTLLLARRMSALAYMHPKSPNCEEDYPTRVHVKLEGVDFFLSGGNPAPWGSWLSY